MKIKEFVLKFSFALSILLVSISTFAASLVRPMPQASVRWRNHVSSEQFRYLVRTKLNQVDLMQGLWQEMGRQENLRTHAYLAGGAFRGLLQWIEQELRTKSYDAVMAAPPPSFDKFILAGADKDIFVRGTSGDTYLPNGYKIANGWDVLDETFLSHSRAAGGSEIEKIGANPYSFFETDMELEKYYTGRIEFKDAPESTFANFRDRKSQLAGNSKTVLMLRHLRFLLAFDGIEITRDDLEKFKSIISSDLKYINAGNYWIKKALLKLEKQAKISGVDIVEILAEVGLARPLANLRYRLEHQSVAKAVYDRILVTSGKVDLDALRACKVSSETVDEGIRITRSALKKVTTATEFLNVIDPAVENHSAADEIAILKLWSESARDFAALAPNSDELARAKAQISRSDERISIMNALLPAANSASEILDILTPGVKNPEYIYMSEIARLWLESATLNKFLALNPDRAQLNSVKLALNNVDLIKVLMIHAAERAQSQSELDDIFDPGFQTPSKGYLAMIAKIKTQFSSGAQLRANKDRAELDRWLTTVHSALPHTRSAEQLIKLLKLDATQRQNAGLRNEVEQLWLQSAIKFARMKPTPPQLAEFKLVASKESQVEVAREIYKQNRPKGFFARVAYWWKNRFRRWKQLPGDVSAVQIANSQLNAGYACPLIFAGK